MNEDVEMDAPQISTLREEETPEPTPTRTSKFRVKLLVNESKRAGSLASTSSQKRTQPESEDEDDDEEDQLIDDDDDDGVKWQTKPIAPAPPPPPDVPVATSSRGAPGKRGGRGRGGSRRRGRAGAPPHPGTIMPGVEVAPSESVAVGSHSEVWDAAAIASPSLVAVPATTRKRAPAKGATAQRAIRKKATKAAKVTAASLRDDAESISEAYAGTAASSPMPHDDPSPEPEMPMAVAGSQIPIEDASLEGVPLPIYPLPSKPFPVQPPVKIATGFAPTISLDRGGKPVRRWRQVNREVRGIAGGRWFARTWVGEKESDFASSLAASAANLQQAAQAAAERESISAAGALAAGVAIPRLPALTSTVSGRQKKGAKMDTGPSTGAPSRAGSVASESISISQVPRKRKSMHGTPSVDVPVVSAPAP